MTVRFSSFIGTREVSKVEGGYTTRVDLELPHRMMLKNLTRDEIYDLSEQCENLLADPRLDPTIYLGSLRCIEEVSNRLESQSEEENKDE